MSTESERSAAFARREEGSGRSIVLLGVSVSREDRDVG